MQTGSNPDTDRCHFDLESTHQVLLTHATFSSILFWNCHVLSVTVLIRTD